MRLRPLASLAVAATVALGVFCFGQSPAKAEADLGVHKKTHTWWGTNSYKTYQYPSKSNSFFFFPNSYVTFDVVNGKYWMFEHARLEYEQTRNNTLEHVLPGFKEWPNALNPEKIDLTFYTPDMRVLAVFKNTRVGHIYSVPRDGNDYERLIVKVECRGETNMDMKMRLWDAVDPVMAEPMINDREGR